MGRVRNEYQGVITGLSYLLLEGRFPKLEVIAGFASSSLTSSSTGAAEGAAVVRDRPPNPEDPVGLLKRFLGFTGSAVVEASVVEGKLCERNLNRLRP